ncbi:MAG: serine/threonine-protein kinase [Polyangiaceae bacterium]|jgi:serine/threonine-protein kinase
MSDSQQRYRVIERLESGGMAEVFRAESEGLQGFRKQVAIKRVLPHLSSKKKFISMFLDEARLSAQLSHSNCVQVFDIGVGDAAFFIVMEFVDGANLKAIIEHLRKTGRDFPVEAAVFISLELCKGLAYAHELTDSNGVPLFIVHRDMSPPNVLVTKYGEVKIVDFGLAKANSQLEKSEPGIIKGKFSYLSPEAAMGQDVDARTDIFAVGIILWELLAAQRLFLGDTDFQTVKKVQASSVPSISQINKKVPPDLERIIVRALARDPAQRYTTARALGQDLSKFMFRYGVPVSTFDIQQLVQGAMKERQRYRPQQTSIIDKLIEEALLEFTSLTDDPAGASVPVAASRPKSSDVALLQTGSKVATAGGGYLDMGSWIEEISVSQKRQPIETAPSTIPPAVTAGNLAALEEDFAGMLLRSQPPPARPVGTPSPSGVALAVPAARLAATQPDPTPAPVNLPALARRSHAGTKVGVAVALVVVMAAGAAAWLTHVMHP